LVVYEKELYFRVGQLAPSQRASQRGELKYAIPQISILINFAHIAPSLLARIVPTPWAAFPTRVPN
jgi:hypothetical protein